MTDTCTFPSLDKTPPCCKSIHYVKTIHAETENHCTRTCGLDSNQSISCKSFVHVFLTELSSIPASIFNQRCFAVALFFCTLRSSSGSSSASLCVGVDSPAWHSPPDITYLPGCKGGIGGRKLCEYKIQDIPFQVLRFS